MAHTLLLMRHADAAMFSGGRGDKHRALSRDGVAEARDVGAWLRSSGLVPDLVLASSAKRARETANQLGTGARIVTLDELYHGGAHEILAAVRTVDDVVATLLVVAHAPGIPTTARLLADPDASDAEALRWARGGFGTATAARLEHDGPWADLLLAPLVEVRLAGP